MKNTDTIMMMIISTFTVIFWIASILINLKRLEDTKYDKDNHLDLLIFTVNLLLYAAANINLFTETINYNKFVFCIIIILIIIIIWIFYNAYKVLRNNHSNSNKLIFKNLKITYIILIVIGITLITLQTIIYIQIK